MPRIMKELQNGLKMEVRFLGGSEMDDGNIRFSAGYVAYRELPIAIA